jgi:hypothetical protein
VVARRAQFAPLKMTSQAENFARRQSPSQEIKRQLVIVKMASAIATAGIKDVVNRNSYPESLANEKFVGKICRRLYYKN